jgi:hypothetical protein
MRSDFVGLADRPADTEHAPTTAVTGLRWSRLLSPEGFSLWLRVAELDDGATLTWDDDHGDEAVHVTVGMLEIRGATCAQGGALIVEQGVAATATARGRTTIAHFGPQSHQQPQHGLYGPPSPSGHGVHVIGPLGRVSSPPGRPLFRFFADSTCPTCRVTLLLVERDSTYVSEPHSHSQDELIYVLRGGIQLGKAHLYGAGTCLPFAADQRYAFRAGPEGFTFLNYRCDASLHQKANAPGPRLESGLAQGGVENPGEDRRP